MLLRESSPTSDIDLHAAVNDSTENGVPHGASLNAFAEAVLGTDDVKLNTARNTLLETLGPQALVDSAAVVASFMQMDRIADATGIPLDNKVRAVTDGFRAELGLNDFGSAQNTLSRPAA
jgi:hypothetical protein